MQLQRRFKPSFGDDLVLFHSNSEVVEVSEIGAGGAVAFLKRLGQQSHGKIFILSNTKPAQIGDRQIDLGRDASCGRSELIPMEGAFGVWGHSNSSLIKVAHLVLCLRASVS